MILSSRLKKGILIVIFLVLALGFWASQFLTDWFWFNEVGYRQTLITRLLSDWGLRLGVAAFLLFFFYINLTFTTGSLNLSPSTTQEDWSLKEYLIDRFISRKRLGVFFFLLSLLGAFLFSSLAAGKWLIVQQYINAAAFGINDPLFSRDISYFVFTLPFYHFIHSVLIAAVVGAVLVTGLLYLLFNPHELIYFRHDRLARPQIHVSALVACFFLIQAWGFRLSAMGLVSSSRGAAHGANYTDIHVLLPGYNILTAVAVVCALIIFFNAFRRNIKLVSGSIMALLGAYILLIVIVPSAVQKLHVEPNEYIREEPYLRFNIDYTRMAYGLDKIEVRNFPALNNLTAADLEEERVTLDNIRLWDYRPLLQTYSQLQEIRPYYFFKDVDIDRYVFDGKLRQVMLSARELDQSKLPERAQNWINKKLHYTHGYGLAMNPANSFTPSGQPDFIAGDLPFRSDCLEIEEPRIYFGEVADDYVITGTARNEYDYPSAGDDSFSETRYQGQGGVAINNLWRRLLFAFRFNDYRLLISSELTPQSKILYHRNILNRVNKIMPYLHYDPDPYLVAANNRLYWFIEAYTLTNMYPYAEPVDGQYNYIRNSVKVIVDAYNGTVDYYIVDPEDPLIKTIADIFPDLFKPLETMPREIEQHLRYPPDLLAIQAGILGDYHMENTALFYNKEDAWNIAEEIVGDKRQTVEPYFTVMQLPGAEREEFVLMLPYTPARKVNLIAWLAARNDSPNYGQLVLCRFPKDRTIYGPMQIESRIDQDARISQQLTLWDQRGSQVIRGNLLVLPIKESLLYIEPIFLQAQESKMPELRQVIVAYGDSIVMADSMEEALASIFGLQKQPTTPEEPIPPIYSESNDNSNAELIKKANTLYNQALERQKTGDWAGYGEFIQRLGQILTELEGRQVQ